MAILIINGMKDLDIIKALATKTGCKEYQEKYPFIRVVYDSEAKRKKALDLFRKNGFEAEIEA